MVFDTPAICAGRGTPLIYSPKLARARGAIADSHALGAEHYEKTPFRNMRRSTDVGNAEVDAIRLPRLALNLVRD